MVFFCITLSFTPYSKLISIISLFRLKAFAGFEQNGAKGDLISNEKPFVCPTSNGHFGDPNDCTKFYKCAHGIPIAEFCPATLFWNQGMFFHVFLYFSLPNSFWAHTQWLLFWNFCLKSNLRQISILGTNK